jgi:hypothetical protein
MARFWRSVHEAEGLRLESYDDLSAWVGGPPSRGGSLVVLCTGLRDPRGGGPLSPGIVHSHGGIVLEHRTWFGMHDGMGWGDRFSWFSSTARIAWNVTVSSLMLGATVVVDNGSPTWPDEQALWRLADRTRATHFGTSAGYLTASQRAGLERTEDVRPRPLERLPSRCQPTGRHR